MAVCSFLAFRILRFLESFLVSELFRDFDRTHLNSMSSISWEGYRKLLNFVYFSRVREQFVILGFFSRKCKSGVFDSSWISIQFCYITETITVEFEETN